MSETQLTPSQENKTPSVSPGTYSPSWQYQKLYMKDTIGAIFLGVFAVIFLVGWIRTEGRYRKLLTQREITSGNDSLDSR